MTKILTIDLRSTAPRMLGSLGTPSQFVLYGLKNMCAKFDAFTRFVTIFPLTDRTSCLFGVQSRRKKFGDKVQAKSSNLPRRFCSNSVGTPLEFAAFRSGFDAKYSRASAFWFFLSTTMVFTAFRTHFARKNTSIFMLIGSLSRRKK